MTGYQNGEGHTFADLFAGTGVVGSAYKEMGYNVIANDIQYYSYVLNKHLIENIPKVDDSPFDALNSLSGIEGFVYNNYCAGSNSERNYFTDGNGLKKEGETYVRRQSYICVGNNQCAKPTRRCSLFKGNKRSY
ncbi:MAG: DNA adenine methylase [Roseburia sp.]|nr:DNA adenine methylase [Roseburia sp.]